MFTPQLNLILQNLPWGKNANITGMLPGYDAYVLGRMLNKAQEPMGVIVKDFQALTFLEDFFRIFYPGITCISFPPWDCVPYDRISPKAYIGAARSNALSQLKRMRYPSQGPWIFITTVEAFLQKVPAPECFLGAMLDINVGDSVERSDIVNFFEENGYRRVDTVYEPGDYALRGSLIDLYSPDYKKPFRVDFFDLDVESIKEFDPITQRSDKILDSLRLGSVSEVPYTKKSRQKFREKYREAFGVTALKDHKFQSILAGRSVLGTEHLMPLFYDKMCGISQYLPASLQWLIKGEDIAATAEYFLQEVEENYQRRKDLSLENEEPYRPLAPHNLYSSANEWEIWWQDTPKWFLQEGNHPTDTKKGYYNTGGQIGYNFSKERLSFSDVHFGEKSVGKKTLYDFVVDYIKEQQSSGKKCFLSSGYKGRLSRVEDILSDIDKGLIFTPFQGELSNVEEVSTVISPLESGFTAEGICIITDQDILGVMKKNVAPSRKKLSPEELLAELSSFSEGDYIVHEQYGIGLYKGLKTVLIDNVKHDFIELTYAQNDKLLVPVENLDIITRYSGSDSIVPLDKMSSPAWQAKRARIKKHLMGIADKLIKTAAERQLSKVETWLPLEDVYDAFCEGFPYELTLDQQNAEQDVLEDFSRGILMDRLICGDVGFGKTEIALRAAFIAATYKTQVCIVVPTTLLCRQHYKTFHKRFKSFGIRVAQISRLVSPSLVKKIKQDCYEGKIDILICTHAAFGKGLKFKNLGLVILDEEQHFGVVQKESLKKNYSKSHILTLTATPIPRTLQLSLAGIRPMSLIATPPVDRQVVRTFVLSYDSMVIAEALRREFYRGGQSFYVCPRLKDLVVVRRQLEEMVPDMKVAVAHGQMKSAELEKVMESFYEGQYDILLSTNIVESGIDISNANTMIIHRADIMGLAQLYQLRGRVGRGKTRGYCYLTVSCGKKLTTTAKKRLKVMQSLDALGTGFSIASHDMDIRGSGNLVGEAQAGHVKEVGIELYQQMLKDAVLLVKNSGIEKTSDRDDIFPSFSQIKLGVDAYIPQDYVTDLDLRLRLYRRLANLKEVQDIGQIEEEFYDRFGEVPREVRNLLELIELKILAKKVNIEKLEVGVKGAVLTFYKNIFPNPLGLIQYIEKKKGLLRLRPDHKLMFLKPMRDVTIRYSMVRGLLKDLLEML